MTDKKRILVAPVSGTAFHNQVSAIRNLLKEGYVPDLCLGSSGGNVSIYLGLASKWNYLSMSRVVRSINSRFFVRPWLPSIMNFIPAIVVGFFLGSMYDHSEDTVRLFKAYFSPGDIVQTEVWVGAINEETGASGLFCNRSYSHATIKGEYFDAKMYKSEPLRYLDGDIEKITKSSVASSCIPIVVKAQRIDGSYYIDGGAKFASPLTPFRDEIRHISEQDGGVHITYVSGYDVELDIENNDLITIVDKGMSATGHMIRGFILHDRAVAYECLKCNCNTKIHLVNVNSSQFSQMYELIDRTDSSLLEIYPTKETKVDYTNFEGEELLHTINHIKNDYACRLWWTGDPSIFSDLEVTTL